MAGKARGLPGAYVALFKKIEELGGISTCADALAGYTLAPREVQPIQTYLQENLGRNEALVRQIGCVIGTHAGPGAFGLAFLDEASPSDLTQSKRGTAFPAVPLFCWFTAPRPRRSCPAGAPAPQASWGG